MLRPVREVAQGRWRGILPAFGVGARALSGKHCPCPMCGGKDRFRFSDIDGRGTWFCNKQNQGGDGLDLVMCITGMDFAEAAKRVEELAGGAPVAAPKPQQTEQQQRDAMTKLWRAAKPVITGDAVDQYLRARLGDVTAPQALRTLATCRYQDDVVSYHPAMIAKVTDADGRPVMLHRTYLTHDGRKADVPAPRRNMPGSIPDGSAVRLAPPGPVLGVAEGIENALAATKLFDVPAWAALSAVMLTKWQPPADVTKVIIFGDKDANRVGQTAAHKLAYRLNESGVDAEVKLPDTIEGREKADWNDVLLARQAV